MKSIRPVLLAVCIFISACDSYLYYPDNKIYSDPKEFGITPEEIWFKNSQNKKLHSWYFRSTSPLGTKAVFVFFHGNAQNLTSHYRMLTWILEYGYDFFIFDYQGYGKSEGTPGIEATISDGHAALKLAHQLAQGLPLVIFSQSLGGAVALKTVLDLKSEITPSLIVADSTFSSYKEVVEKVLENKGMGWMLGSLSPIIPNDEYAPGDAVANLAPIPLVVVHGDADQAVDYSLGQKIYETAREPKEFWSVPGGKHIDAFRGHDGVYRNRLLEKLNNL